MAFSAFDDKLKKPEDEELTMILGRAAGLWNELRALIGSQFSPLTEEWVFSGKNYGWSLRLKQKKRAILYMTPCLKHFRVGLAFGEKAFQAARQCGLPSSALEIIEKAPKYPEGRAVRFEVRKKLDVRTALTFAGIKMAN
jgi:hypothetical protein